MTVQQIQERCADDADMSRQRLRGAGSAPCKMVAVPCFRLFSGQWSNTPSFLVLLTGAPPECAGDDWVYAATVAPAVSVAVTTQNMSHDAPWATPATDDDRMALRRPPESHPQVIQTKIAASAAWDRCCVPIAGPDDTTHASLTAPDPHSLSSGIRSNLRPKLAMPNVYCRSTITVLSKMYVKVRRKEMGTYLRPGPLVALGVEGTLGNSPGRLTVFVLVEDDVAFVLNEAAFCECAVERTEGVLREGEQL